MLYSCKQISVKLYSCNQSKTKQDNVTFNLHLPSLWVMYWSFVFLWSSLHQLGPRGSLEVFPLSRALISEVTNPKTLLTLVTPSILLPVWVEEGMVV